MPALGRRGTRAGCCAGSICQDPRRLVDQGTAHELRSGQGLPGSSRRPPTYAGAGHERRRHHAVSLDRADARPQSAVDGAMVTLALPRSLSPDTGPWPSTWSTSAKKPDPEQSGEGASVISRSPARPPRWPATTAPATGNWTRAWQSSGHRPLGSAARGQGHRAVVGLWWSRPRGGRREAKRWPGRRPCRGRSRGHGPAGRRPPGRSGGRPRGGRVSGQMAAHHAAAG